MMFRNTTAAVVVLAVTTVLAQATSPVTPGTPLTNQRSPLAGRRGMSPMAGNKQADLQARASLRQRMQDMEETLKSMHAVLKRMQPKSGASSKDPLAKANLDMWELLVGHLDKQLEQMRIEMAMREDIEARRAAMYKQAEAKAAAAAQAARAAQAAGGAAQTQTPAPAVQGTGESTGGQNVGQTTAGQTSQTSSAPVASPPPN